MLIAIEDGTSDELVVDAGLDLAVDEGAEVIFVHVVSIMGESVVPTGEVARVPDRATNEVLSEACEKAHSLGLEATSELLIGYPARQIALVRRRQQPDTATDAATLHLSSRSAGPFCRQLLVQRRRVVSLDRRR